MPDRIFERIKSAFKRETEPMMGVAGMIPPKNDYLKFLREITIKNDVLLIFDEVITSRLSIGGTQELFGVIPDLTCIGKYIGGYIPIGAFGGREDIMDIFSPEKEEFIPHSGTFNGNALAMAAGIACMNTLTSSVIEKMNGLGDLLKRKLEKVFMEEKVVGQVTGMGSLYNFHFTDVPIIDYRTAQTSRKEAFELLHISMLNKGIFIAPRGMFNLSTVMNEKEIDMFTNAFRECVLLIKNL